MVKKKEIPLEEAVELTAEMEDVVSLARYGANTEEISDEFDMPMARVKRILELPIVLERLKYLLADKYERWNRLGEDLYQACMENLITKAKNGGLTEKTVLAVISRQEVKQGVYDDRIETKKITVSENQRISEIPETTQAKNSLFSKKVIVEKKLEKGE